MGPLLYPDFALAENNSWYLWLLVRCLFIIPAIQICRIISFAFCFITIAVYLFISCISYLDTSTALIASGRLIAREILRVNDSLNIVLQNLFKILSTAASLLFAGLMLSVSVNFATIKMSHIIPMPIYLVFPAVAVIIPMIIQVMMPMLIKIYVGGESVIWKWKYFARFSKDLKFVTRMIRARQGVRINVGVFGYRLFFVKKSTKVTYYNTVLSYTISAFYRIV